MKQELEERGYEVPEKWKRDKIKDVLAKELRGTHLGNSYTSYRSHCFLCRNDITLSY